MITSIYWIHLPEHKDIFTQGYVGISNNPENRWKYGHLLGAKNKNHENKRFMNAILKYGWDNLIKEVILVASKDYCKEIEKKLRSSEKIGWNLAIGGGVPPVSKPRGDKYISPLKGIPRPTPWLIGKSNPPSIEACRAGGMAGKGKKNSPEHLAKRMETRRKTRIARGQIRSLIVNGIKYDDSHIASLTLKIPEPTLKYWAYGKGKPSSKYAHITECRWNHA